MTSPDPAPQPSDAPEAPTAALTGKDERVYAFTERLYDAGWRAPLDAQWTGAAKLLSELEAEKAEACRELEKEVERLKHDAQMYHWVMERCTEAVELVEEHVEGYPGVEMATDALTKSRAEVARLSALVASAEGLIAVAKCPECDGSGTGVREVGDTEYVSREMALDAGDASMEGSIYRMPEIETFQCRWCDERKQFLTSQRPPGSPGSKEGG
jgi:hypothetical protein